MHVGKFLSCVHNPKTKLQHILTVANELMETLTEIEEIDLIQQESFSRQAETKDKQLLLIAKTLDEERRNNDVLIKENHTLTNNIRNIKQIMTEQKDTITDLEKQVDKLSEYKKREHAKFLKWLRRRLRKKSGGVS